MNICDEKSLSLSRHSFLFLTTPFQNVELKVDPQQKRGEGVAADSVIPEIGQKEIEGFGNGLQHNCVEYFLSHSAIFTKLLQFDQI